VPLELEEAKRSVERSVDRMAPLLKETSREIYENPELGYEEHRASARLAGLLAEAGFEVDRGVGGLDTAFVASLPPAGDGSSTAGPTVALLAEYDALPGIGHGCGHNIIGTAAAGAGLALARLGRLPGRILVVGCPAEEGGVEGAGGKVVLVEAGVFDGVDAALMFHPGGADAVSGTSSCRLALQVDFKGRTAHAAGAPYQGINALEAVIQTFTAVNALRQHLPDRIMVHGVVAKGGEAPNVVPDEGRIRLYVRAPDRTSLDDAAKRVKNCARGAALATGCRVSFCEFARTYVNLVANRPLDDAFARNMTALGRPPVRNWRSRGGLGSTDMGNVSHVVPAIHPFINIARGRICPASHSKDFARATVAPAGEEALLVGAKALAMTCLDLLLDEAVLEAVRRAGPGRAAASGVVRGGAAQPTDRGRTIQ